MHCLVRTGQTSANGSVLHFEGAKGAERRVREVHPNGDVTCLDGGHDDKMAASMRRWDARHVSNAYNAPSAPEVISVEVAQFL